MCTVRFIGCLHLGHKWMAQHRGFQDEIWHDAHIVNRWNSVVQKRDLTFILGDVTMESNDHYHILDQLNGRKIVVLGNHDMPQHTRELLRYVETVAGMVDYKGFCLTHAPIHPNEISFYRGNIHAHIHENVLEECKVREQYGDNSDLALPTLYKYYCVDAHRIDYIPKSIDDLITTTVK